MKVSITRRNLNYQKRWKQLLDVALAFLLISILIVPGMLVALLIYFTSGLPILYWSDRVTANNKIFSMPKFRTMKTGTPELPTDLLPNAKNYITPFGKALRVCSFDEVPQLWSVLTGKMSMVGPRPVLANQVELLALRQQYGIYSMLPGITGLAQINGRDDLSDQEKIVYEQHYMTHCSLWLDIKIIFTTIKVVFACSGVKH